MTGNLLEPDFQFNYGTELRKTCVFPNACNLFARRNYPIYFGFHKCGHSPVLEDCVKSIGISKSVSPLLAAGVIFCGLAVAGCDEHVEVIQDTSIHVMKHQTWAWRPMQARKDAREAERPVISRDVIRRNGNAPVEAAEPDPTVEIARKQLRSEIERQLTEKGLSQVPDPAAADFLVDYNFAIRGHNATVERVYGGGYPGLVCGPFGCWNGWGYGPPEVTYQNVRFREGTFVFDLTKNGSKELVYRAIGQEPQYHAQFSHDQIQDMVHALLKKLNVRK
jgi:hypothetical protein